MIKFQENDTSIESQWRSLILFGKNSATYKFAFAKSLLELIDQETTSITKADLAVPFAKQMTAHLKKNDKQGSAASSKFLNYCRSFNQGIIDQSELLYHTEKLAFVNVIDAFQNINGGQIPNLFYEKDFTKRNKKIIITDALLKLKESFHFQNFEQETEARWRLVETAWHLNINPNILEVQYDTSNELFFVENNVMRRKDITSVRNALNGYQKGKCFYSFQDITINKGSKNICDIDHFLPHMNKKFHQHEGANINGVWNLVLTEKGINRQKSSKIPDLKFLQRLSNRNEFYIQSKHPLAETIVNQTGKNFTQRKKFLQKQYDIAKENSIVTWRPNIELKGNF